MADKKVDDLDFSDLDLDMNDDGGFDDEFDSATDDGALDDAAPRKTKKGPDLFTYGVYGAVGLAIVGVIVWQLGLFGGGGGQPYQAPGMQPGQANNEVVIPGTEAAQNQQNNGAADPFSVMGTPDAQQPPAQDSAAVAEAMTPGSVPTDGQAALAQPTTPEEAPLTGVLNAGDNTPVQQGPTPTPAATADGTTQPGDTVPMPAPVPAGEDMANNPLTAPQPSPAIDTPTPTAMAQQAAAATPAAAVTTDTNVTAALQKITERLDALETRIDQQSKTGDEDLAAEVKSLKDTLNDMKTANHVAPAASSADDEAAPAPKPAKKKTASHKKSTSKKSASAAKKSTTAWDAPYQGGAVVGSPAIGSVTSGSSSGNGGYTLRAAQPDAAWVSGPDGNLQQVKVGDTVQGLGTVTGISQAGGQWAVETSGGKISQ